MAWESPEQRESRLRERLQQRLGWAIDANADLDDIIGLLERSGQQDLIAEIQEAEAAPPEVANDPLVIGDANVDEIWQQGVRQVEAIKEEPAAETVSTGPSVDEIWNQGSRMVEAINSEAGLGELDQGPLPEGEDLWANADALRARALADSRAIGEDEGVQGLKVFGAGVENVVGSFQKGAALIAGSMGFDDWERELLESGEANQVNSKLLAYESKYGDSGLEQFGKLTESDWWEHTVASLAPGSAPFMAGAVAGGAAGTMIMPVVGTIIGAMLGGGGTLFLQTIGDSYYDYLDENPGDTENAMDYALLKSGATSVLNAAAIPLGLAGSAATMPLKTAFTNAALRVGGAEVTTEVADVLVENQIDQAYIDQNISSTRGMAEAVVGGLLFDAPAIGRVGWRRINDMTAESTDIEQDNELLDELVAIQEGARAEAAAQGGDALDQAVAASRALTQAEIRDPNVRVKRLRDPETGEVIYEQKQTQAEVEAEDNRLQEMEQDTDELRKNVAEQLSRITEEDMAAAELAEQEEIARLEEEAKAEQEALSRNEEPPTDPLEGLDLTQIAIEREVQIAGSDETVMVTESADKLKRQLEKRQSVVDAVMECVQGA